MKKLLKRSCGALVLCLCLALGLAAAVHADEYSPAVFKTTEFEVKPGGTVSTTLYLDAGSDLVDFELQLKYDTEYVSLVSAACASTPAGEQTVLTQKDGAIHLSFTNVDTNLTKRTEFATFTFAVDENVGAGSYDFLTLDTSYAREAHTLIDGNSYPLPIETAFAPLTIHHFGDVDLNGTVSIADVTMLRQYLVDKRTLTDYQQDVSDTFYDHAVSLTDAAQIQQYLADHSIRLGNRWDVYFLDAEQNVYRIKSVVEGQNLATVPALPARSGYYGGVWSSDATITEGADFQDLQGVMTVYARYKKDASPAVTFYKERLTDVYYSQSTLTGNLSLVNRLTYQGGYTADIYWSSTNGAVLNATTGAYNAPNFDSTVTLTATIISYQDGVIEAQDYIAFDYTARGQFLCPSKDEIAAYLSSLFMGEIDYNMTLPTRVTDGEVTAATPFEVRLAWTQTDETGTHEVTQLERDDEKRVVTLTATATFNGVPLEDDGRISFDGVTLTPAGIGEVRSYVISQIAANTGLTLASGAELWHEDTKYHTTINWQSGNHDVATVDGNGILTVKPEAINGSALPLTAEVTYTSEGVTYREPGVSYPAVEGLKRSQTFKLAYTVNVVSDNAMLVPGTNVDQELYNALKAATGVHGTLTTDALKATKFVYLDLSGYPGISDLTALSYCRNLRVLNISGLHVDEVSLNQICTLSKLEALIANNCGITSLTAGGVPVLDKMINLKMLDLAHNELTSLDDVLSRNNRYGQLEELYLNDNQLTDISALCEVVQDEHKIYDSDGNVTETYVEDVVRNGAPMLSILVLDNNHLNDADLVPFSNFKVLQHLSLGNNEITTVSPLKGIAALRELHLQDNRIEDVRDLRYLTRLESLYLGGNRIRNVYSGPREVNVSYLRYLTKLEILYLDHNEIEDVSDLDPLDKLTVLNVNGNRIQDLSILADKGETLVELYAEDNQIDSFSFIHNLTNLERLMLARNAGVYEASLSGYLSGLTKLRTLTLSGKDLRSLAFLANMGELIRLDVDGCNLASYYVGSYTTDGTALTVNSCVDNVAALRGCKNTLKYLDVSNNGFAYDAESISAWLTANGAPTAAETVIFKEGAPSRFDTLYELTNLKVLYADNLVDPVNADHLFSVMTGLNYLSLENCGIRNTSWLTRMRNLIYLDLAGNEFRSVDLNRHIAARSKGTLEYLYVDSRTPGTFANIFDAYDGNVLKEFSAANVQVGAMDNLPNMADLTYLNLADTGITSLSGDNADYAGWYNLSRYQKVETLDLSGLQADIDEAVLLPKLKTLYAIGDVEDAIFQKSNLLQLYGLYNSGVTCYLYDYASKYVPKAEVEGGLILGTLEDYSLTPEGDPLTLKIAAQGAISDNNPVLPLEVNGFDINWTVSNTKNYTVTNGQIAVRDYADIEDETLILTAAIDVYPDQPAATRSYEIKTNIVRAKSDEEYQNVSIDATGAENYLKRGDTFTYDVTCVPTATDGFAEPVLPVYTEIRYSYSTGTDVPYDVLLTVLDGHNYQINANAALGAEVTIHVEVGHSVDGVFYADKSFEKKIQIVDTSYTLTFVPNGGTVRSVADGTVLQSMACPEESTLFETFTVEYPGYVFNGWYTDENCTQFFWNDGMAKPQMPSHDLTLYASWTEHSFNVWFADSKTGSTSYSGSINNNIHYQASVAWRNRTESNVQLKVTWVDTIYSGKSTYYGQSFAAGFHSIGQTVSTGLLDVVPQGRWASAVSSTRTASMSTGWITVPLNKAQQSMEVVLRHFQVGPDGSIANTDIDRTVTLNIPTWQSKGVLVDLPYGELPVPTRTGYTFSGWFTAQSGGEQITADTIVALEADQVLYPHWTVNDCTVTFDANGGSSAQSEKTVTYGQTYGTLPEASRPGFTFQGWYTQAVGGSKITESTSVTITAAQTLYAHWSPISYTASWNDGTGYSITVERTASPTGLELGTLTSGATVQYGDQLSITYTAWEGYSISGSSAGAITVTGDLDSGAIYATASPNEYTYTVVYQSTNGTWLGSTTVTANYTTTNTITAPGFTGYATPSSQSVAWDSTTAKTITFYYSPNQTSSVTDSAQVTIKSNGYSSNWTVGARVEYRNRTANSVEIRVVGWVAKPSNWSGYGYGFKMWTNPDGRYTTIANVNNFSGNSALTKEAASDWVTVSLGTTGPTTVSVNAIIYPTNSNGLNMHDYDGSGPYRNIGIQQPIPAY